MQTRFVLKSAEEAEEKVVEQRLHVSAWETVYAQAERDELRAMVGVMAAEKRRIERDLRRAQRAKKARPARLVRVLAILLDYRSDIGR